MFFELEEGGVLGVAPSSSFMLVFDVGVERVWCLVGLKVFEVLGLIVSDC